MIRSLIRSNKVAVQTKSKTRTKRSLKKGRSSKLEPSNFPAQNQSRKRERQFCKNVEK